ncbi:hypothetical protein [Tateyamaria sp.]|uniref:hypothetical protein n=1 Tax=Tateyamaria sp. TaxID=1929288 RepID=UPI00329B7E92
MRVSSSKSLHLFLALLRFRFGAPFGVNFGNLRDDRSDIALSVPFSNAESFAFWWAASSRFASQILRLNSAKSAPQARLVADFFSKVA